MRDLIPDDQMGRVFGSRQQKMLGIGIITSLLAAGFIDLWGKFIPAPRTYAFGIVYALAFGGGLYAGWAAARIRDVEHQPGQRPGSVLRRLQAPFGDTNFRRLMVFLCSWNFATMFLGHLRVNRRTVERKSRPT